MSHGGACGDSDHRGAVSWHRRPDRALCGRSESGVNAGIYGTFGIVDSAWAQMSKATPL